MPILFEVPLIKLHLFIYLLLNDYIIIIIMLDYYYARFYRPVYLIET